MQQPSDPNQFAQWRRWFQGVPDDELARQFVRWQQLSAQQAAAAVVMTQSEQLDATTRKLESVMRKLDYEVPYRIVVLGESGAGKSTLINALLGQNRLVTGAGAAITGAPVYVHPLSADESEAVLVFYRTDDEFRQLVDIVASAHDLDLSGTRQELRSQLDDRLSAIELPADVLGQLNRDLVDILTVWERLDQQQKLGTVTSHHPDEDRDYLRDLMEERSALNAPDSPTRLIPGIARLEYRVRVAASAAGVSEDTALQSNVVLIDTPGVGARTLRHQAILRQEVINSDAVILVVNARRPEDKSASMAHLLGTTLLDSFTDEQRDHFAQKVFLVTNQMDAIQSADDQRRLDESIQELSRIISPNFWARHVYSDADLRYFATIAQLAVLAQQVVQGEDFPDQDAKLFRGYLEHQLTPEARATDAAEHALTKSQVPALRSRLNHFLSAKRLQLMLDEAAAILHQVPSTAQEEGRRFFEANGLTFNTGLSLESLGDRNVREFCQVQLNTDRNELLSNARSMLQRAQQWRRSDEYRQSLFSTVEKICNRLDEKIGDWIDQELVRRVQETSDTIQDNTYMEMLTRDFLVRAEQNLRALAEHEAQNLADYYLDSFHTFLKSFDAYELIEEKSYDQDYIQHIVHPLNHLGETQAHIDQDFSDICRWVIVYELLRNPILTVEEEQDFEVPQVAKEVALMIAELAVTFDFTGTSQPGKFAAKLGLESVKKFFQETVNTEVPKESVSPVPRVTLTEAEKQRTVEVKKLLERMETALKKRDRAGLRAIVSSELGKRNRKALSSALPYLDMLFFYEIDKFDTAYRDQVEAIHSEHFRQVIDRNSAIRNMLVKKNNATLLQAQAITDVLSQLHQIIAD